MELFLIYLWLKIDTIICAGLVACFAYFVAMLILQICTKIECWDHEKEIFEKESLRKKYPFHYIILAVCFTIFTAIPNSKNIAILVASSYAIDFSKSPTGEKVKSLLLQKAEAILDEELKKSKLQ